MNRRVFYSTRISYLSSLIFLLCVLGLGLPFCEVNAYAGDKARSRAERALRDGDLELAEKLYREILEQNASDNEARLGLSYTLYKMRDLRSAFDHAARVVARDPLSARAHALLGTVVLATGDFRLSVEEFRTALSLNENEALAVAGLAMVDFYENRLQSSFVLLRRAVELDSREPDFLYSFAQTAARTERFREAAAAYERFLIVAPHTDADRRARIRGLIEFMKYLSSQSRLYTLDGEDSVTVPFEVVNNRPIIKIRINGLKEPLRFVLDTGSGMCVVSEETARRLGLRSVARGGQARAVGGGGRFEIVYGFLTSLAIGGARVENVPVYIRRFFEDGTHVDGYIGLSVINKYITTVDYGTKTFSLARQQDTTETPLGVSAPGSIDIPIRTTSSGFLSGEVQLEGIKKPLNFIVDTGASVSVVAESVAAHEDMNRYEQDLRMRIYGAAGVAENVKVLLLPRLTLGSLVRERISAAVLDLNPINETTGFVQSGIIGGNFLSHFRLTFDFRRGVLSLDPLVPVGSESERTAPEGEANVRQP
jgi:predicted aspartyl protease